MDIILKKRRLKNSVYDSDNDKNKLVKFDKFVDRYYFNVIRSSPIIGNNLNFYSKYANYDGNTKFFNTMFLIEKIYFIDDLNNKDDNNFDYDMKLNEEQERTVYLNLLFKIDTLHDFNDASRTTINNKKTFEKNILKELLEWNSFNKKNIIKKINNIKKKNKKKN